MPGLWLRRKLKTMSKAKTKKLQTHFYTDLGKAFLQYDPVTDKARFHGAAHIAADGRVWYYLNSLRDREEAIKQLNELVTRNPRNQRLVAGIKSAIEKMNKSHRIYLNHYFVQCAMNNR